MRCIRDEYTWLQRMQTHISELNTGRIPDDGAVLLLKSGVLVVLRVPDTEISKTVLSLGKDGDSRPDHSRAVKKGRLNRRRWRIKEREEDKWIRRERGRQVDIKISLGHVHTNGDLPEAQQTPRQKQKPPNLRLVRTEHCSWDSGHLL